MNLYYLVRNAEEAFARGEDDVAEECLRMAEMILKECGPQRSDIVARCCYVTLLDGRIHCGTSDEEPLFLATPEERKVLCQACAVRNAARVAKLKAALAALRRRAA
jgi:hypothetical protein